MTDRRNFLSWLTGLFVASPVAANEPIFGKQGEWLMYKVPQKYESKGFIVVTLNVGTLPPYKADAFVEKVKEKWRNDNGRLEFNFWELIVLPVRPPQESKVEIFAFNAESAKNDYIKAQKLIVDETPFIFSDKKEIRDYVLLMLGAPVVRIELDEQQLDCCYDMTKNVFENVQKAKGGFPLRMVGLREEIFRQMVHARTMMILGMVRKKWKNMEPMWLDGESLYEQGSSYLEHTMGYLES